MLFETILYLLIKIKSSEFQDHKKNLTVDKYNEIYLEPINILCRDNKMITFEYQVWSKYEYFFTIMRKIWNKNEYIEENFNSEILEKIRKITLGLPSDPLKIEEFQEILVAINKFLVFDRYISNIYNNLFSEGIHLNKFNEILDQYHDSNYSEEYSIYKRTMIDFWHFFWYEVLKRFDLSLKIYDKTVEINNHANTNIYDLDIRAIKNVNELKFNLTVFNSDKVMDDIYFFLKVFKFLIYELINNKNSETRIKKLTIHGKCTLIQQRRLNLIFMDELSGITDITFDSLYIDHDYSLCKPKSSFEIFIKKAPVLARLDITIPYFESENSFVKFLENKIVKTKLRDLKIENIYLSEKIISKISELKAVEKFDISYYKNYIQDLFPILNSPNFKKNVTDLSLREIPNLGSRNAWAISEYQKIEILNFEDTVIFPENLTTILQSVHIKNTLKKLILPNSTKIFPLHANLISDFNVLEKIGAQNCSFINDSHLIILRSEKLQKTIKEIDFIDSVTDYDSLVDDLLHFNRIERLEIFFSPTNREIIEKILNKKEWHHSVKELYLHNFNLFHSPEFLSDQLSLYKSLETFGIIKPENIGEFDPLILLKAISSKDSIKKLVLSEISLTGLDDVSPLSSFKNLEVLDLSKSSFLDSKSSEILKLRNLQKSVKELHLANLYNFTEDDSKEISKFENLEVLNLEGTNVSADGFFIIFNSKSLQRSIKKLSFMSPIEYEVAYLLNLSLIENFEALENFTFLSWYFDPDNLKSILKSKKIKYSLKYLNTNIFDDYYSNYNDFKNICNCNLIKL
ncbi:hypothetical protein DMUE_1461 [Dictyocoela muelleri]|nr:hypothetical protein DMUE_1461 [Dictyocoela muelleri]